jgi:DNA-binding GntR family transcriptional regulator
MSAEKLARIAVRTLKEDITAILRRSIIDGSIAPGSELNQAQIADQLGVSRGPLREALGQLEHEGLIESTPYKGVVVTPLTRQYVEELFSVRAVLENLAITRAVERVTSTDIDKLKGIVEDMRAAAQTNDLQQLGALDLAFHEHIVRMAQHDLLVKLWKLLEIGVQRCLHARYRRYASPELIIGSHPAIVEAIASRNKRAAATVLHEHIGEAAERVLEDFPISLPENGLVHPDRAYP